MITLEDDMLTVKTDSVRIIPNNAKGTDFEGHAFFEGSAIRKINDKYYFIYSSQLNHELCYATSKYPDREFKYGGTIVSAGDIGLNGRKEKDSLNAIGTTHGSIEKINGRWYVFYHRLTHGSDYSRQGCAEVINIENDGSIKQVEVSSCGLNGEPLEARGKYPAIIACNITNGKMPRLQNRKSIVKIPMVTHKGNERYIANIDSDTTVKYKYFNFESAEGTIKLDIDSSNNGKIQMYLDDELVANAEVISNGRAEIKANYSMKNTGKKALSFRFAGKGTIDLYSFELLERLNSNNSC